MSGARTLRIGTRASALALWQANRVADLIRAQAGAPAVELVHIRTEGDMRTDVPLWAVDGRAFFTKEIDRSLLANEIDLAVHSLKDLSTVLEKGTDLVAVVERQDPRDAFLSRNGVSFKDLPAGSRIGTSSLRRRAFLKHLRPDIQAMELRGNVPTRVEKMQKGEYDAIILASAGLVRLGLDKHITERLPTNDFTPAVSQGAIGVCARSDDAETLKWLKALDNTTARFETTAERALLRKIEGGCQVPLGAIARVEGNTLRLFAQVAALDGSRQAVAEGACSLSVTEAAALGQRLADELLAKGANEIIAIERGTRRGVAPA